MKKSLGFTFIYPSRVTAHKGFTLIELLVVISIIALLSSVVMSAVVKARTRARDSARIQNARQIAIALEQYEATFNTYKVADAGLNNSGTGYVAKSTGDAGYSTSILSVLKSSGLFTNTNLKDPIYGTDNYYLGLCTSTNAYNVFVKLEQPEYNNATSSIVNACGGAEASALGFSFIASTAGGSSGGASGASDPIAACGTYSVVGQDTLTYGTVLGADGRCWLDRNIGATRVATAINDSSAYGGYYQWGRIRDGHQISSSGVTSASSSSDTPLHANFILDGNISPYDWRNPQNNSLWQGVSGINNPCPSGFRLPIISEWQSWITSLGNFTSATCGVSNTCNTVAFNSTLKLTAAGNRYRRTGAYYSVGSFGNYWTGSVSGTNVFQIGFGNNVVDPAGVNNRANGLPVRCIKD